jgi:hypothetical protein
MERLAYPNVGDAMMLDVRDVLWLLKAADVVDPAIENGSGRLHCMRSSRIGSRSKDGWESGQDVRGRAGMALDTGRLIVHDGHMPKETCDTHNMTTTEISKTVAMELVDRTARMNRTGRLGTPCGSINGYSLAEALSTIERGTAFHTGTWGAFPVLYVDTPHGEHVWYLNLRVAPINPWES